MKSVLKNKAFKMFNQWVTNAKTDFPNLNYQVKELSNLENDLEQAAYKAAFALGKEEKREKRKKEGFDYGFICGFIIGNLNVQWYNEYIYKQSNQYKMFEVIAVLEFYFKFDDLKKIQLKKIYQDRYASEVNIDCPNLEIAVSLPENLEFLETENVSNPILATLENLKIEMISSNMKKEVPEYLETVYAYISEDDALEILRIGKSNYG